MVELSVLEVLLFQNHLSRHHFLLLIREAVVVPACRNRIILVLVSIENLLKLTMAASVANVKRDSGSGRGTNITVHDAWPLFVTKTDELHITTSRAAKYPVTVCAIHACE